MIPVILVSRILACWADVNCVVESKREQRRMAAYLFAADILWWQFETCQGTSEMNVETSKRLSHTYTFSFSLPFSILLSLNHLLYRIHTLLLHSHRSLFFIVFLYSVHQFPHTHSPATRFQFTSFTPILYTLTPTSHETNDRTTFDSTCTSSKKKPLLHPQSWQPSLSTPRSNCRDVQF